MSFIFIGYFIYSIRKPAKHINHFKYLRFLCVCVNLLFIFFCRERFFLKKNTKNRIEITK